ncbi:MAG: SDR family NAD(P)-dependent oxidoreductase, partial [Reichenbachiella sp.]
ETKTAFHSVVKSNRQTEADVRESGLQWVIGRNGIYMEPDLEYLDTYIEEDEIRNCAGEGKCAYTSREELAFAYTQMLLKDNHNGQIYNLAGEAITQAELASLINQVYNTDLKYHSVSVDAYEEERKAALGEFIGGVISGIYEGIKLGINDVSSDFEKATGRAHLPPLKMIEKFKNG